MAENLQDTEEQDPVQKLACTAQASPDLEASVTKAPVDLNDYTTNRPPATRKEVLSYYAYFAGNNGIGAYQ